MKKRNICIALIIALSTLFLSGCRTGQIKSAAPEILAEFEYSGSTNRVFLPVEFQGQVYQFGLDTGTSNTVFDIRFRDNLGKPFLWPIPFTTSVLLADGRKVKGESYPAPKAKIGPLKLKGSPFVAVIDCNLTGGGSPGIIGMDFLKKYVVQIDYDSKKVTFFKGKREFDLLSMFKPKENKHPEWGEPVPLKTKLFSEYHYHIEGSFFDDIETDFLIDSGWGLPDALNKNVLERIYSYITHGVKDVNTSSYIVEHLNDEKELIESFSVGSLEYKNKVFLKNDYSVLGRDFLSRHIVTFDFPNNIMYLKKGKNFDKQPSIFIHLGSTGCVINPANFEVVKADPNRLAYEKGIREKDILIKINNHDISYMSIIEFQKSLSKLLVSEDGKSTWTFKRGEETFTFDF